MLSFGEAMFVLVIVLTVFTWMRLGQIGDFLGWVGRFLIRKD